MNFSLRAIGLDGLRLHSINNLKWVSQSARSEYDSKAESQPDHVYIEKSYPFLDILNFSPEVKNKDKKRSKYGKYCRGQFDQYLSKNRQTGKFIETFEQIIFHSKIIGEI